MSRFDGIEGLAQVRPRYGDVIAVHRRNGLYDHYGVYANDGCVYEYAGAEGDAGDICIRASTLKKFIGEEQGCFVVPFPRRYEEYEATKRSRRDGGRKSVCARCAPWLEGVCRAVERLAESCRAPAYHLYTPAETVERAKTRLGERKYSLGLNNCEHYAIWCKTGLSDSRQVDGVLTELEPVLRLAREALSDPVLWRKAAGVLAGRTEILTGPVSEAASDVAEWLRSLLEP